MDIGPECLLDKAYKIRLQKNRVAILDDLSAADIIDSLIQDDIITADDEDEINTEKTRREKAKKLLDMIYTSPKGPVAYRSFRKALISGYGWLVEKLDNTNLQSEATKKKHNLELNPGTLHKISHHPKVMKDWQSLGRLLNVPESDLVEIEYSNPRQLSNCVYETLHMWQTRCGRKATGSVLVEALCNAGLQHILGEI